MPAIQRYTVEVETRVRVISESGGSEVVVGQYTTRATFQRDSTQGRVSEVIEAAVAKAGAYSRAHAAAVDNNEAKRLKP